MNLSIMVKNYKGKVCNMYQDEYKRWLAADLVTGGIIYRNEG